MRSKISVKKLDLWYGKSQALHEVDMEVPEKSVTAIIGPSGCGKSTLIRCINRMNDHLDGCRVHGEVIINGSNIYGKGVD
jgi:phosphate transport system ATP-binding protein